MKTPTVASPQREQAEGEASGRKGFPCLGEGGDAEEDPETSGVWLTRGHEGPAAGSPRSAGPTGATTRPRHGHAAGPPAAPVSPMGRGLVSSGGQDPAVTRGTQTWCHSWGRSPRRLWDVGPESPTGHGPRCHLWDTGLLSPVGQEPGVPCVPGLPPYLWDVSPRVTRGSRVALWPAGRPMGHDRVLPAGQPCPVTRRTPLRVPDFPPPPPFLRRPPPAAPVPRGPVAAPGGGPALRGLPAGPGRACGGSTREGAGGWEGSTGRGVPGTSGACVCGGAWVGRGCGGCRAGGRGGGEPRYRINHPPPPRPSGAD